MASTILYKFRSGTTFEALPLPGSAARLFDVKKAIVKAKKLDSGSIEFDLAVRNADTNEEYGNEAMLLPRGTRLIVQRLPAQRGHGFLARMARNEHAGTGMPLQNMPPGAAPSGYYTIESRAGDDDEFVSAAPANDEKELAALQAATSLQSDGPAMTGGYVPTQKRNIAGSGAGGQKPNNFAKMPNFRPNADPELRDQEKKMNPKKGRATGIPRTFLSLSAPPPTDGLEGEENESSMPVLQPNSQGFKDLVNRGGGQSENTRGTRRDLDYALKLTATTVPEYLQCGICHNVVSNAMLLPWDPEGRTTCETCIRDGLTQNGFRCPLTGMDGVSPDDLLPNVGLRKAVEMFIKGVMDKVDEIEQQQVEEAETTTEAVQMTNADGNILDGMGTEKGVIVSKKSTLGNRKKSEDDDPFGGDDDFGGDVFAVEVEESNEDKEAGQGKEVKQETEAASKDQPTAKDGDEKGSETKEADSSKVDKDATQPKSVPDHTVKSDDKELDPSSSTPSGVGDSTTPEKQTRQADTTPAQNRRERRRGPPVGYAMGPAGASRGNRDRGGSDYGGRGGRGGGRFQNFQGRGGYHGRGGHTGGRGYFENGGGHVDGEEVSYGVEQWLNAILATDQSDIPSSYLIEQNGQDDRSRKRSFSDDHSEDNRNKHRRHDRQDDRDRYRGDSNDGRNFHNEGRGQHRGGFRGRGRSRGRGGGGFRGGRGRRY